MGTSILPRKEHLWASLLGSYLNTASVCRVVTLEPFGELVKPADFHPRKTHGGADKLTLTLRGFINYPKPVGGKFAEANSEF